MTPQYISSLLQGILPALQPLVSQLEHLAPITPQTSSAVTNALTEIEHLLTHVGSVPNVDATAPVLTQIQAYAEIILNAASMVPLPFPASLYLRIASTVVLTALSLAQTVIASQAKPAPV